MSPVCNSEEILLFFDRSSRARVLIEPTSQSGPTDGERSSLTEARLSWACGHIHPSGLSIHMDRPVGTLKIYIHHLGCLRQIRDFSRLLREEDDRRHVSTITQPYCPH